MSCQLDDRSISTPSIAGSRTGGRLTFFARAKESKQRNAPQRARNDRAASDSPARRFGTIAFGHALMRLPALSVLRRLSLPAHPSADTESPAGANGDPVVLAGTGYFDFSLAVLTVIPAKAGIQLPPQNSKPLDSCLRRNDGDCLHWISSLRAACF